MNLKFNKITILLCAVATVVILGVIVNQLKLTSNQKVEIEDKFAFDKVTLEKVEKIEFIRTDETVTLMKTDGIWKIGEKDANDTSVNSFISIVNEANADKLVSTNSENHSTFRVDDTSGVLVKFYKSGDNLIEQVIFGNYVTGGKVYGRKVDGNNVYAIDANIFSVLNQPATDWEKVVEEENVEETTEPLKAK